MMRTAVAVVLLLNGVTSVWAQQPSAPPPSIGLPLPPIGLPLPPLGLSPPAEPAVPPRPDAPGPPRRPGIVIIGAVPYAWGFEHWQLSATPGVVAVDPAATPAAEAPPAAPELGRLQIEVRPRDAQLFVNDEFIGTWTDLSGALDLPPGTHRIEIRARGFANHAFDARILADRTITYRAELTPRAATSVPGGATGDKPGASPSAPGGATGDKPGAPPADKPGTFYLIPGCYLGNIPPAEVKLPAGCDLSRVITHTPGRQ
jgi:hypothetical protein